MIYIYTYIPYLYVFSFMANPRVRPMVGSVLRPPSFARAGRGDAEALRRAAADGDPLAAAAGGDQRRRSSDAEATRIMGPQWDTLWWTNKIIGDI